MPQKVILLVLCLMSVIFYALPSVAQERLYGIGVNMVKGQVGYFDKLDSDRWDGHWTLNGSGSVTFALDQETWAVAWNGVEHTSVFMRPSVERGADDTPTGREYQTQIVTGISFSLDDGINVRFDDGSVWHCPEYLAIRPYKTVDDRLAVRLFEFSKSGCGWKGKEMRDYYLQ